MACCFHVGVVMGFKHFVTAGSYVALTLLGKPPPHLQGMYTPSENLVTVQRLKYHVDCLDLTRLQYIVQNY